MLIINSQTYFTPFNIATEEHLIKNFKDDILLFYINDPSIIIGKHQNTLAEIDLKYVTDNNIYVVRRLSGGGAVFHDRGNLNFSFITNTKGKNIIDFRKFTEPILTVLNNIGVKADFYGRNDLVIDGKKFSGNSSHIYKDRICHHGTILYNVDLTALSKSLKPDKDKFIDKAVKSVRSRVANICEYIGNAYSIEDFRQMIVNKVRESFDSAEVFNLSDKDIAYIDALVKNKYDTWEWNFGASPEYNQTKSLKTKAGKIDAYFKVEAGIIKSLCFYGDFFGCSPVENFESLFIGREHNYNIVKQIVESVDVATFFMGFTDEEIISLFF
jgi:lipoate---protein ligase